MDINLDTGKLYIFISGFILFLIIETLLSARKLQKPRYQRLLFHLGLAAFNTITIRLFIYVPFLLWAVYVDEQGWGISRWLGLYGWTEILISLVVLDAFDYFWHRANHRVSFLWRFHKAHHSDTEMDVTTSLRFHPGELAISAIVKGLWILIWGPTVVAWFLFEMLVSLCAQFHHSNIDFPDYIEKPLALFLVTPRYHLAHHLVDRHYGDANFSTIFSLWDRLFGTYSIPLDNDSVRDGEHIIGLPENRESAFQPIELLREPIKHRNLNITKA
jgi:sterol desaturase/sphingolipid hydroxylase (fatty acid hydroxylase superfamily)